MAEFLDNTDIGSIIDETAALISDYVEKDPTKFCTYEEFEQGVSALKLFCRLREESVKGQLNGSIPSTSEGQSENGSSLINASELKLSEMGTMNNGGMGGGFGGATGGRTHARARQRRGTDLRIRVKMSLEDIAKGVDKTLKIPTYVKCEHCNGTGAKDGVAFATCNTCHGTGSITQVQNSIFGAMQSQVICPECEGSGKTITERCSYCNGEGIQRKDQQISFHIPAGVSDGMILTVRGKGNAPRRGGVNGDLLVVIEEVKHPELIRDGNDVIYNLMLDLPTAILGGSVEVPTISGRARLKIAAGTQPGKVLRLRGKGLPSQESSGTGDELINVMVYIPENLSDSERQAIETLKGSPNITPTEAEKQRIFSKLKHIFE